MKIKDIYSIKDFCEKQHYNYLNEKIAFKDVVGVESDEDGVFITNPFLDCSGNYNVDPIKEYGEQFCFKFLNKYINKGEDNGVEL